MARGKKSKEPRINCAELQKKYNKVPLDLFLDAVSLGMNDEEVAAATGLKLKEVKKLRQELGDVGSNLDITHKKDICTDASSEVEQEKD